MFIQLFRAGRKQETVSAIDHNGGHLFHTDNNLGSKKAIFVAVYNQPITLALP